MQKKKTYELTGLFVILGIICFCGIIMHYVGKKFAADSSNLVVMYFEESISGLTVGSPVVFRGVEVGKVVKIRLVSDLKEGTFKTPVYVSFNQIRALQAAQDNEDGREMLNNLINKGLRAQLMTANYLTGQLMIELQMDPNSKAVFRGTGRYPEIPTTASPLETISKDLQELPLQEIIARMGNVLNNLDENLPQILENINNITTKIDHVMDKKNSETTKTLNNFNNTLEEISKASRSIKNLTDYLERHPEAIIQGKEK